MWNGQCVRRVAGAAGAAVLLGTLLAGPAAADGRVKHPELDVAGAQIKRVEGTGSTQDRPASAATGGTAGLDVSSHQNNVDWGATARAGARFAYVKATEGTDYTNPSFDQQFSGARGARLIAGAYHFALPDQSDGGDQADFFVDHGGGWTSDGSTMPPALDIEYNPYGDTCYGMSPGDLVGWLHDFVDTVAARTGRQPVIYTSTRWWAQCTGNDPGFGADPLWIPHYGGSVGQLPAGWDYQSIWQNANSGPFPGDQDLFNGPLAGLHRFATG